MINPWLTISDRDSTTFANATVTIANSVAGEDRLTFVNVPSTMGNITVSQVAGGVLQLTSAGATATTAQWQAALRSVKYSNISDNPTTNRRFISYVINDGDLSSNVLTSSISITAINDAPSVARFSGFISFTENGAALPLDVDASIIDVDSPNFDGGALTVSLIANANSSDRLSIRNQGSGSRQIGVNAGNVTFGGTTIGTFRGGVGAVPLVITLNAAANPTSTTALLRNITFRTVTENPSTLVRTARISFADGDGGVSNGPTKMIGVVPVNDAPVATAIEATPLVFQVGTAPIPVSKTLAVSDPDSTLLTGARVQMLVDVFGQNRVFAEDVLSFRNTATITGTFDETTGVLTLVGDDTVANYIAALRTVKYQNTNLSPHSWPRTISFEVSDDDATSNLTSRSVSVLPIIGGTTLSRIETTPLAYTAGNPATLITSAIQINNVLAQNATILGARLKISENYVMGQDVLSFVNTARITAVFDSVTGTLVLSGADSLANYQTALRNVKFRSTSSTSGTRSIAILVNDNLSNSNVVIRRISLTALS